MATQIFGGISGLSQLRAAGVIFEVPVDANGNVANFAVSGSAAGGFVRLSGDTMTGPLIIGTANYASGTYNIVNGTGNTVLGTNAVAIGTNNTAAGTNGFAMGSNNNAAGTNAIAMGTTNTANGNWNTAFGASNTASATASFVIGTSNTAAGNNSFVGGISGTASNNLAFAFGSQAVASSSGTFTLTDSQPVTSTNSTFDSMLLRFQNGIKLESGTSISPVVSGSNSIGTVSSTFTDVWTDNGIILKDSNGKHWRITVSTIGVLGTTAA